MSPCRLLGLLAPNFQVVLNSAQQKWALEILGCNSSISLKVGSPCIQIGWTSRLGTRVLDFAIATLARLQCLPDDLNTSRAENIPDFNRWDWKTVGIPKRTSLDSRPISVASVLVRAWHKALLSLFPEQPQSQWAGRRGVSCLHAIAAFLATPKTGVAELDLSKAFDTVDHSVADIAMQTHGIHRRLRQILLRAWKAPRHCVVGGVPSLPINPLRGLPQGDPVAPAVLGMVLAPWCGDSCHDEQRFAFVDDRTIVAQGDRPTEHLAEAIQRTAGSDEAIGISENRAKRQLWVSGQDHPIEHLGLKVFLGDPNALILPRDDWCAFEEVIKHLAALPGAAKVRERLASAFVLPKARWGCPLIAPPPERTVRALFRAILSTHCTLYLVVPWQVVGSTHSPAPRAWHSCLRLAACYAVHPTFFSFSSQCCGDLCRKASHARCLAHCLFGPCPGTPSSV